MIRSGVAACPVRAARALLAVACAVSTAACVSTGPAPPAASAASAAAAEPPVSAYVAVLRSQGVEAKIPSHGKFILVNVPAYELIAFQDGTPVLRSRVVVGRPATPTPELLSSMTALRFNPSWTPTPAMIRNEGLRYMPPGPHNPLGRVMFDLDNDQLIYLHDTNEKYLFARDRRAFSHGCVRVEQARALAAWVLGVSEEEIDAMIARGTWSVPLSESILVDLAYYTTFPDAGGALVSHADIYGTRQAVAAN